MNPIFYTAIGDSLTVGTRSMNAPGFVEQYTGLTENTFRQPVLTTKFAKKGATTGDILWHLNGLGVGRAINDANIITITAGGNDLLNAGKQFLRDRNQQHFVYAINSGIQNYAQILNTIYSIKQGSDQQNPYIIKMINLYNPLPNIPEGEQWIGAFNAQLQTFAKPPQCEVVNIHDLFAGRQQQLLSWDHVHPNPLGYEVIAKAIYSTGYGPLLSKR